jgi:hypothetical protein
MNFLFDNHKARHVILNRLISGAMISNHTFEAVLLAIAAIPFSCFS